MSEQIHIRTAEPADVLRIAELYRAWWDEINGGSHAHPGPVRVVDEGNGHPDRIAGQTFWLDVDPDGLAERFNPFFLVADARDVRVAGFLYAYDGRVQQEKFQVFRDGGRFVEISDLYVDASLRGIGIGKALLQAVLNRAEADGVEQFHVMSDASPELARFYEGAGFVPYRVSRARGGRYEAPPGHPS